MAEFTIRPYGDPVLRAAGEPVREFGAPLRTLGDAMLRAMKAAKGIGLAAPQVGLSLQLFVMDVHDEDFAPVLDGQERRPEDIMPMLLANATVTITHVPTGSTATSVTGPDGRYSARGLRAGGPYRVSATAAGERRAHEYGVEDFESLKG